ncbi:hypothetical protein BJF85_17110 [Saccharomonospora sp. CUA-673]|uniref:LmeA family phospholipid-binding protein n=1 Tax=Saccharomonospora sp. CUA-673 TaxID=1904969 RepID=UPI000969546D|nr:DUF2993 domain-containing protein [Saccharomonospora sp. CUA-673]OLT46353.1 hypothetical protein BJF85_17110 [Saccharomonospora sp. CUA-673]
MRRIITVLVLVVGVLVAVDFGAATFAEHTVSQQGKDQLGVENAPEVGIHGFPFLTQAIGGNYGRITVEAKSVPVQDMLRDVDVKAELRDVDAPLTDLTEGNVDNVNIGEVDGEVTLKASDINQISPLDNIEDLRIAPSSEAYVRHGDGAGAQAQETDGDDSANTGGDSNGENGEVGADGEDNDDASAGIRLSGKVKLAGQELEIYAFAMIRLSGTTVEITPQRLQFGNDRETTVVPQAVQQQLLPSFEADINTGDLPFTVTPTGVEVGNDSITVKGNAKDVVFGDAAITR